MKKGATDENTKDAERDAVLLASLHPRCSVGEGRSARPRMPFLLPTSSKPRHLRGGSAIAMRYQDEREARRLIDERRADRDSASIEVRIVGGTDELRLLRQTRADRIPDQPGNRARLPTQCGSYRRRIKGERSLSGVSGKHYRQCNGNEKRETMHWKPPASGTWIS